MKFRVWLTQITQMVNSTDSINTNDLQSKMTQQSQMT